MKVAVGAELEGILVSSRGEFADTQKVLGEEGWKSAEHRHEALGCDVAACSLEAATTVCEDSNQIRISLDRALGQIPEGYKAVFMPRTPYPGAIPIAQKPRYAVMARALTEEHPTGFNGMTQVAPWNAVHFHIGVGDVLSKHAVLLLNILNNIAPNARLRVIERFGIKKAEGHLTIWTKFTKGQRLPAPRWFASPEQMMSFIESVPMLFYKDIDGIWKVGDGRMSCLGDAASEGVLWWLARPRGTFGTNEWRPFPSMQPGQVFILGHEVFKLVHAFWYYVERYPSLYVNPYGRDVARLYSYLAESSWLMPDQPLSDDEWWQQFSM